MDSYLRRVDYSKVVRWQGTFFAVTLLKCFCSVVKLLSREVCQALLGQHLRTFLSISLENTLSRSSRIHSTASYSLGSPLISI